MCHQEAGAPLILSRDVVSMTSKFQGMKSGYVGACFLLNLSDICGDHLVRRNIPSDNQSGSSESQGGTHHSLFMSSTHPRPRMERCRGCLHLARVLEKMLLPPSSSQEGPASLYAGALEKMSRARSLFLLP